ncbi:MULTISPECIES: hypothetical protein [Bacillus]|uniref:hypothetical protein n=1 Tax=Bacillus TaxID=1386 RepID=UPI000978098E|nr:MULTISPECIES: hypothetical protein [Bacillus]OMP29398.1 hypothetical protein BAE31_16645 [Bacillus sp. I-2]QTV11341.1 hypothetical protein J9319_13195 [Bacillus altitudinis]
MLTETVVREALDRFFDSTAHGNEGHADVERLVIEGTKIQFRVKIVHRHVVRVFGQRVTVYSLTTDVEGNVDVTNPDPDKLSYTIQIPGGSISVSLLDVIQVLAALA